MLPMLPLSCSLGFNHAEMGGLSVLRRRLLFLWSIEVPEYSMSRQLGMKSRVCGIVEEMEVLTPLGCHFLRIEPRLDLEREEIRVPAAPTR